MQAKQQEGQSKTAFFLKNMGQAAFAACFAELCTIPADTAKVRLQIQKIVPGELPRYRGVLGTVRTVAAEEGPRALWNGIVPGLQRQVINSGLRIGLYVPIRDTITGPLPEGQNPTLFQKVLAAICTGGAAICVANPTDLVKIKM